MADVHPQSNFQTEAVVVIHGMGEQMPMDTIRGFVRAVWETDAALTSGGKTPTPAMVWSKPDNRTGSLELRRITTRPTHSSDTYKHGVRCDFYELYWADLSAGSTLQQVEDWTMFRLLLRNPFTRVPREVRLAWVLLWLVTLAVVFLAMAAVMPRDVFLWRYPPFDLVAQWANWTWGLVSAILALIASRLVVPYFGCVVRYTRATPENVAARQAIRQRGLELLAKLHDVAHEKYSRIIIVGHSLGSILAYDLVSYFWAFKEASRTFKEGMAEFELLRALEHAAAAVDPADPQTIDAYRRASSDLGRALRNRAPEPGADDPRWIVTDLVTLGSPLTHADFLLASDIGDLNKRIASREFPVCPPFRETLDPTPLAAAKRTGLVPPTQGDEKLMSFNFDEDMWQLHHAAPFAVVRWTNIYDPGHLVFFGDIISGPLRKVFGHAIRDVNLQSLRGHPALGFTHTSYWSDPLGVSKTAKTRIAALRHALDLAGDHL